MRKIDKNELFKHVIALDEILTEYEKIHLHAEGAIELVKGLKAIAVAKDQFLVAIGKIAEKEQEPTP